MIIEIMSEPPEDPFALKIKPSPRPDMRPAKIDTSIMSLSCIYLAKIVNSLP